MSEGEGQHPDFDPAATRRFVSRLIGLVGVLLAIWFVAQEPVWTPLTLVVFAGPISMILVGVASEFRHR